MKNRENTFSIIPSLLEGDWNFSFHEISFKKLMKSVVSNKERITPYISVFKRFANEIHFKSILIQWTTYGSESSWPRWIHGRKGTPFFSTVILINIVSRESYVKTFRSVKEFLDSRFLFSISFLLPESSDQIPNLIPNPNSFP